MRILLITLTSLMILSFHMPSLEVAITGHLRSKTRKNVGNLTVFVKGAIQNGLGVTATDKNGDFILGFDDSDGGRDKPLSFYYVNERRDTVLLKRVLKLKSDAPEMTFWIK